MSKTFVSLAAGDFVQDWSDAGLITANDDWSGVAGIVGYLGNDVTSTVGVDPTTLTGPATGDVDVIANQTNPNTLTSGGVAEFQIADPTVALQGSGTADAPSLVLYLDATGRSGVHVEADIRDIDGSADNTTQQVAIQYRLGDTGNWVDVPNGYIGDATTGPNLATAVTHLSLDLPSDADGQSQVEVRFITVNATGSDEWVGIDNIHVSSSAGGAVDTTPPTLVSSTPGDDATGVDAAANVTLTFSEPVYAGLGNIVLTGDDGDVRTIAIGDASQVTISGGQVTINPTDDLHPGDAYHLSIGTGVLQDVAGNAFAGTGADPVDFTTVDPSVLTPIYTIQGEGHTSAYAGAHVSTSGVVTAIDTTGARGFWIQDPAGDGNPNTSDGVFVFTNGAADVTVGQLVQVDGVVTEYNGGDAGNLTTTEINSPVVHVLGAGTVAPVVLGEGGDPIPTEVIDNDNFTVFDPAQDGIDFFEAHEGELVTIHNAVAVDSTYSGSTWVLADGGADATGVNGRGGITISADDFNPERIQVYVDSGVLSGVTPDYAMGQSLGDVTGVISYYNGEYELLPVSVGNTAAATPLPDETTTIAGATDRLTFGEYNVENLDPTDPKFDALAHDIVANLGGPDILSLEEIQDADSAGAGADLSGATTLNKLIAAIAAAGGPHYAYVEIAPTVANANGGEPGGNIRNAFLYNVDRVDYVAGSARLIADDDATNGDAFYHSRMPLAADFSFNGETVTAISVHDYARSGSDELYGATQPPVNSGDQIRIDQDAALHRYVLGLQAANPDAKILVGGDFNGFQFETSLTELEQGGSLHNLDTLLTPVERYSTEFEGLSQQIDHILVSTSLQSGAAFDIVHLNTGQPAGAGSPSDHDPTISSVGIATVAHTEVGTISDDQLYGGAAGDSLSGGDGNDLILGHDGDDTLNGDAGADTLDGGAGADLLYGGDGADLIYAGVGVTSANFDVDGGSVYGGAGDDHVVLSSGGGEQSIYLGAGVDTVTLSPGHTGDFANIQDFVVGAGGDVLDLSAVLADLPGYVAGTDPFVHGNLFLDEPFYASYVNIYAYYPSDSDPQLIAGVYTVDAEDFGAANLSGFTIENVARTGGSGNDFLTGFFGADTLTGLGGDDQLVGRAGADLLYGGDGKDRILAGPGDSVFGGAGDDQVLVAAGQGAGAEITLGDGRDTVTLGDDTAHAFEAVVHDFQGGAAGDVLDLTAIVADLTNYTAGSDPFADGHIRVYSYEFQPGVYVDVSFDGDPSHFVEVAYLGDASGLTADDLTAANFAGVPIVGVNQTGMNLNGGLGDDTLRADPAYPYGSYLNGNAGNDLLIGASQADLLYGGGGDDTLVGGPGGHAPGPYDDDQPLREYLDGGAGLDTIDYATSPAAVFVDLAVRVTAGYDADMYTIAAAYGGDAQYDALINIENISGTTYADTLGGDDGANVLTGLGGDDHLKGRGGADALYGGQGADLLAGGDGNDTLDGGFGADTLQGGAGDDLYLVESAGDLVFEKASEGIDTVQTKLSAYILGANLENLAFGSAGTFTGTGNGLANVLTGGGGADVLDGGAGADTVYGGLGNDTITVGDAGDRVFGGSGVDTVIVDDSDFRLNPESGVEVMVAGGTGGIALHGAAGAQHLIGNAAANLIEGGGGSDTLDGGGGNDTFRVVLTDRDEVTVDGGAGSDLLVLSTADALPQIFVVTGASASGFSGYMGDVYDGIGFTNIDRFDVTGGDFNDFFDLSPVTMGAVVHALGGDNSVIGGFGADSITSGSGADTLDGRGGADTLIGGGGNDTYYVDDVRDVVVEQVGGGHDQGNTTLSVYTLAANVEDLSYTGAGTFNGTGNSSSNTIDAQLATAATLRGGAGDDMLVGSTGADSLYGDGGADTVNGGDGNDYVRTLTSEGPDTVDGGAGTDLLTIERTDLSTAFHIDLTASGEEMLAGDGGSIMNVEQIRFAGGSGADSVVGGALDDVLKGNGGNDTLSGEAGNDVLQGGTGADSLTGGAGADTFRFDGPTAGDGTVTDFQTGVDHVALSHTGFGIASLADFDIVDASTGAFEAKATLIVDTLNHTLSWDADGTGAATATLFAHGAFTTSAADYMVF